MNQEFRSSFLKMGPGSKTKRSSKIKPTQTRRVQKVVPKNRVLSDSSASYNCHLLANAARKSCAKLKYIKARMLASSKSDVKIKYPLLPKTMIDFIDDDEDDKEVNDMIYRPLNVQPSKTAKFRDKDESTLNQENLMEDIEKSTPTVKLEVPRCEENKSTYPLKIELTEKEKPLIPENASTPLKCSLNPSVSIHTVETSSTSKVVYSSPRELFSTKLSSATYKPPPTHSCCMTVSWTIQGTSPLVLLCNVCKTRRMFEFEGKQSIAGQPCHLQDISKHTPKDASSLPLKGLTAIEYDPLPFTSEIAAQKSSNELLQPNMIKCHECHLHICRNRPQAGAQPEMYIKEPIFFFEGWKVERVVGLNGSNRTILIKQRDRRRKWNHALGIVNCIDETLKLQDKNKKPDQIYLVVNGNKVIGVVACVSITEAYRIADFGVDNVYSQETYSALCGISSIWVDRGFRRQGIASQLLEAVRRNYLSDVVLKRDQIAFSPLTADGKRFAQKYCRRKDFLVYI
ncbi:uncharacterized protein LOC106666263 isoform X2 [Cimex lectularius]|uniref:N-acetyltransferase ESCO acetyl-transferase domain-containing protein n=1 Tax=Cimex lectularius TaxID=79782 RepID=A0A8I6RVK6_CIMLE|nr:uncharacterized protein LOC106666263 isoform X2 [Cimex lectularius]